MNFASHLDMEEKKVTRLRNVCPVHAVEMDNLREDLAELKARVQRLESTLARGVMLLVANLVGVILTLAQQLANR